MGAQVSALVHQGHGNTAMRGAGLELRAQEARGRSNMRLGGRHKRAHILHVPQTDIGGNGMAFQHLALVHPPLKPSTHQQIVGKGTPSRARNGVHQPKPGGEHQGNEAHAPRVALGHRAEPLHWRPKAGGQRATEGRHLKEGEVPKQNSPRNARQNEQAVQHATIALIEGL
eukprot:63644-Alexandrium_andersonii.AAC.1